jgi:hypothetical protein
MSRLLKLPACAEKESRSKSANAGKKCLVFIACTFYTGSKSKTLPKKTGALAGKMPVKWGVALFNSNRVLPFCNKTGVFMENILNTGKLVTVIHSLQTQPFSCSFPHRITAGYAGCRQWVAYKCN